MPIKACVFDAYGTLFDVAAAAREAAAEPGAEALVDVWPKLAEVWRLKQLQYTWLRAVTGDHTDFWQVTQDGLDFALEATGLRDQARLRRRLLQLYQELSAYAEVPDVLSALKEAGQKTAILSNGSPAMLDAAVTSAGVKSLLDAVLSVETVGVFKPHRSVYDMVGEALGTDPAEVLFVSSNGWDAAAGAGYGFCTLWVNRAKDPVDRLPWRPAHIASDLSAVPNLLREIP